MPPTGHEEALSAVDMAAERVRIALGNPSPLFYRAVETWKESARRVQKSHVGAGMAPRLAPDRFIQGLMIKHEGRGQGEDSDTWLFAAYAALKSVNRGLGSDPLEDLDAWKRDFRRHTADFPASADRPPSEYAPDHLLWWKLRRASEAAWTWLAYLALAKAGMGGRARQQKRYGEGQENEEIADELVAWALEVDRRERTMEAEAGVQAGTLAGRLVYLPHRASIGAWLHQVGLQQVRRTFARRRGIAPSAVALDPQGGLATDDSSKPSRSPQPLVTDGREGVILGDLGSNWDACRGAVADDYLTGKELEALRLAAAVHWERAREEGLSQEAFSWALFGRGSHGEAGKRLQAVASRLFLWLRLTASGAAAVERELERAVKTGWISDQQIADRSVGLAPYLADQAVRHDHLRRGGATWGVHGRLQFAVFNACAALIVGAPSVARATLQLSRDPALGSWLSRKHLLGLDGSPLLLGDSPVQVFGPRGPDQAVPRRSVWDMLETAQACERLATLVERAEKVIANNLYGDAVDRLGHYDPLRREDIARLRDKLRQAHRAAPDGLPRMAATYWLYDPNSNERDRLRSLLVAAHTPDYPELELAETCERPARSAGWSDLDGTPLLRLLRLVEETR